MLHARGGPRCFALLSLRSTDASLAEEPEIMAPSPNFFSNALVEILPDFFVGMVHIWQMRVEKSIMNEEYGLLVRTMLKLSLTMFHKQRI